ncbi:hypothetical protein CR513_48448, partial [Mucuna pruriens]
LGLKQMAPNCVHASNPYHQCTQACSQTKAHTNKKKNSGYGRSVTDVQLAKKINDQKRTYSGCPKASNPYHHCDDNCFKRLSDSGAPPPLKFDTKKKLGSKPEPPVLDSIPPSKVGAIFVSDASSPISHYSEKKKLETQNNEQVSSKPISGQTHIPAVKDVNEKEQVKDVEDVGNPMARNEWEKIGSDKVVPMKHVDESSEEGLNSNPLGESESVTCEGSVEVGTYKIKESFGPILESIIDKYGDIGASCHLESVVMRSYYMECVCFVVQELQSASSVMQLSKSKVKELLSIVKDVESAQIGVAWLRSALDEVAENIEVEEDRQVETLRKELESELESLAEKEQEIANIKTRIPEIRGRLSQLELKASQVNQSMLSIKSKLDELL